MEKKQLPLRQPQRIIMLSVVLWCNCFFAAHSAHAIQHRLGENPDKPNLSVQLGHTLMVMAVACSSDMKLLLTGGDSGAVLWDVDSGREIRRFTGQGGMVMAVAFSRDNKFALTGGYDHSVRLWNVETGAELKRFSGHKNIVVSVGFLADPNQIFSAATEEGARIWQVSTGKEVKRFSAKNGKLASFAVSRDGRMGLIGTTTASVELIDLANGNRRVFTDGADSFQSVAFSPDAHLALASNVDGRVFLWEVGTGKQFWKIISGEADRIAFSPDGKTFLTGTHIWSVETGKKVGQSFKGHKGGAAGVTFSPDGSKAFTSGFDGSARLWDVATAAEVMHFSGSSNGVLAAAFSLDGRYLATTTTSLPAQIWDLRSGEVRLAMGGPLAGQAVAFSPDGNQYAFAIRELVVLQDIPTDSLRYFKGHTDIVRSIAFSPDGKNLLTGGGIMSSKGDNTIRLWDVATAKQIKRIGQHAFEVHAVAFSLDGRTIASGGYDGQICLWDTASATLRKCMTTRGYVFSVAFSPDGTKLLTGHTQEMFFLRSTGHGLGASGSVDSATARKFAKDNVARLWDVATLKEVRQFDGHSSLVHTAAFSPDGRFVVLGTGNFLGVGENTARLFEAATGKEIQQFKGHGFDVMAAAFTPDGRLVMTASIDGSTRLWEPATGKEICRLILTADGTRIVLDPQRSLFDTNGLEAISGLQWVMNDEPLRPLPIEIFMRDYYEPRLLPRLLAGDKFKPIRSLTELNRVQPLVQITRIEPRANTIDTVAVTVEVSRADGKYLQAGKEMSRETGVYDLRLFRDWQLVGYAPQMSGDFVSANPDLSAEQELQEWRRAKEVKLDANGKAEKTFIVKLPHTPNLKRVVFSAYAFNVDRVKSVTDTKRYELPKEATAAPIKGRAYLVTVGVNVYESPEIRSLLYPANDARSIRDVVSQALRTDHDEIVAVPLIAENAARRSGEDVIQATKANFKLVLELLAGKDVIPERLKNIPQAIRDNIRAAGPDDLILISFATHGEADDRGNFYLYPFDTGPTGSGQSLLAHCISSEELSLWLRDVDAGDIVMILDTCYSGAAPGAEFKPGPMGSRGLGQLAYDKGMRVLAATQSDNVALGSGESLGGLLTTALIRDGLQKGRAAQGGKITIRGWLEYGVRRVPQLYSEEIPKDQQQKVQQPALFDFARRTDRVLVAPGKQE
jgi:WD40 repeat protein